MRREQKVDGAASLTPIEAEIARLGSNAARTLLALQLTGTVALIELVRIEERLSKLAPQLFHLASDTSGVSAYADAADLEALNSPVLSDIAQRLKATSEQGGAEAAVAHRALRRLFALARQAEAEGPVMKIRAIRLKEVGRFSAPMSLEGLSGGLDVLIGPNEFGKSTILKARAILALFEQHPRSSANRGAPSLPGGAPLIEVDFDMRRQILAHP